MNITYRLANEKDTLLLATWWRDGEIMAHAGFPLGLKIDEEKLSERLRHQEDSDYQVFIIEYDGESIGELGVKKEKEVAEIGIKVCEQSFQNKGLGTKVLKRLISNLFECEGIQKIILDTMLENTRAQKVYERLGFVKKGIKEDAFVDQLGNQRTAVLYELTKEDYQG